MKIFCAIATVTMFWSADPGLMNRATYCNPTACEDACKPMRKNGIHCICTWVNRDES